MGRLDRLREYDRRPKGLQGEASSKSNLKGWSDRAATNSQIAPRAADGPMKLPDTGKAMGTRPTTMAPFKERQANAQMAGKDDLNHVGSSPFMKSVRREA